MTMPLIICVLVGMVLGQRFKVLVLLPAIGVALIVAIGVGVASADSGWSIVLMAVSVTIMLQIGYVVGIGIRSFTVAARTARLYHCPASVPTVARRRPAH
jgi:hypothetical protein